jgi:hypothetical protein
MNQNSRNGQHKTVTESETAELQDWRRSERAFSSGMPRNPVVATQVIGPRLSHLHHYCHLMEPVQGTSTATHARARKHTLREQARHPNPACADRGGQSTPMTTGTGGGSSVGGGGKDDTLGKGARGAGIGGDGAGGGGGGVVGSHAQHRRPSAAGKKERDSLPHRPSAAKTVAIAGTHKLH